MNFKFVILLFLIIMGRFAYSQSLNSFKVNTICLDNDTSIEFPQVVNCPGSDSINAALFNVLRSYFPCKGVKTITSCLEKAKREDLDKLSFSIYNSDSTISFDINIMIKKHNQSRSFKHFLTYSHYCLVKRS